MKVLVFGGNGCIGSCVVELLLKHGVELTLLNRGNWRWNTLETVKPHVKWSFCDRERPEQFDWTDVANGGPYAAVLDFSAYSTQCIRPFYKRLKTLSRHYVYISSCAIYEMCDLAGQHRPLREEAGIRPEDLEMHLALARRDSYADGKLLAEEFLLEERKLDGMSFTILRLPDVLGERDSTNRFWLYQMWLQLNHAIQKPVTVQTGLKDLSSSYVYVGDIASCILGILLEPSRSLDQVFNFSSFTLTLTQLLHAMGRTLKVKSVVDVVEVDDEDAATVFPSVACGPLDCSRIHSRYEIRLTEPADCLQSLCSFYQQALNLYPSERDEAFNDFCELLELSPDVRNQLNQELLSSLSSS